MFFCELWSIHSHKTECRRRPKETQAITAIREQPAPPEPKVGVVIKINNTFGFCSVSSSTQKQHFYL